MLDNNVELTAEVTDVGMLGSAGVLIKTALALCNNLCKVFIINLNNPLKPALIALEITFKASSLFSSNTPLVIPRINGLTKSTPFSGLSNAVWTIFLVANTISEVGMTERAAFVEYFDTSDDWIVQIRRMKSKFILVEKELICWFHTEI
jgi:hypothetical protein